MTITIFQLPNHVDKPGNKKSCENLKTGNNVNREKWLDIDKYEMSIKKDKWRGEEIGSIEQIDRIVRTDDSYKMYITREESRSQGRQGIEIRTKESISVDNKEKDKFLKDKNKVVNTLMMKRKIQTKIRLSKKQVKGRK